MTGRVRLGTFVAGGLALAVLLALLVSPRASGDPDGLERVAIDEGFAAAERRHDLEGLPTAGYAVEGVDDEGLSTGLAGLLGLVVTFVVTGVILLGVRRTRAPGD